MIIKRKYACYYQLLEDPASREAMLNAFKRHGVEEKDALDLLNVNGWVIVHNTDMGSCIKFDIYNDFCASFDKLDVECPFDNQLTYSDVSDSVFFASRKGNALMQVLYCRYFDLPIRIVQVVAFEHDGSGIKPIEPWELPQITL